MGNSRLAYQRSDVDSLRVFRSEEDFRRRGNLKKTTDSTEIPRSKNNKDSLASNKFIETGRHDPRNEVLSVAEISVVKIIGMSFDYLDSSEIEDSEQVVIKDKKEKPINRVADALKKTMRE